MTPEDNEMAMTPYTLVPPPWTPRYHVGRNDGELMPEDEPCLVIRGQDILAPAVLLHYLKIYETFTDHDPKVIRELEDHLEVLREWQRSHRIKLADR